MSRGGIRMLMHCGFRVSSLSLLPRSTNAALLPLAPVKIAAVFRMKREIQTC